MMRGKAYAFTGLWSKTDYRYVYFFSRPYLQVDLDTSLQHYGSLVVLYLLVSLWP